MNISQRVLVKDNVYRSVQITPSGKALWIAQIDGKSVSISGSIVDNTFIPNEKYFEIFNRYVPQRISCKQSWVQIKLNPRRNQFQSEKRKKLNQRNKLVNFMDEVRKITYSTETSGTIDYKGIRYYGRIDSQFNFTPISSRKVS